MAVIPQEVIKLNLSPAQITSLVMFDDIYTKHPEKIKKLLTDHGQKFSGDELIDMMQVAQLSQPAGTGLGRGRFFTEDFEEIAKGAKYFSLGDAMSDLGPIAGLAANIAAPGSGALVSGAMQQGGSMLNLSQNHAGGSSAAVNIPPSPQSPAALVADPAVLDGTWTGINYNQNYKSFVPVHILNGALLDHPLGANMPIITTSPGNISIPGLAVTGVASSDGKTIVFSNGGVWVKLSNTQDAITPANPAAAAAGSNTPNFAQLAQQAMAAGQNNSGGNLNNNSYAQQLAALMAKTAGGNAAPPAKSTILGMSKTVFFIALAFVVAAIITVIIIFVRKKKKEKELAAKK